MEYTYWSVFNGGTVWWKGQPVIPLHGYKSQDKCSQINSKDQNSSDVISKQVHQVTDVHMFGITSVDERNTAIMNR
jgi:hypothetical protein